MATYPRTVEELLTQLRRLPGIGSRSAERMVNWLLAQDEREVAALAEALVALKRNVRLCARCCNLSDTELCAICRDATRERTLCVVEEVRDLMMLEKAGCRSRYFVLGGHLSALGRVGPEQLRFDRLLELIARERPVEVIIATNPTPEGEDTALYLSRLLRQAGVKHSRLACGMPVGAEIEYVDAQTLKRSLEGRTAL